ncbi:MAG: hypothetical protein AAF456_19070 [Planctomycetota bacterium]
MNRANADTKFLLKFLIISIALLGYLLYCLYDGLYAYPKELERAEGYAAIKSIEDDAERDERWKEITTENNWKYVPVPKPPEEVEWSITEQFIQAALCAIIALPLLIWYFRKKSSWVESDGSSLSSSWGQKFSFEDVQEIDKKKWDKKGIALIKYQDGGEEETFKFDDLAYDRKVMDQILYGLEQAVGAEKIVNGEPERDPAIVAAEKEKAAAEKRAREDEEMSEA